LSRQKIIGDKQGIAASCNNLAIIYKKKRDYKEAIDAQFTALSMMREMGDKHGVCLAYINTGHLMAAIRKMSDAERYYKLALDLAKDLGNLNLIMNSYRGLAVMNNQIAVEKPMSLKKQEEYFLKAIAYYDEYTACARDFKKDHP
jgi:tetratricopeptide (TPR) repeat protein